MITYRELNRTDDEIKEYHKMRCELYLNALGHIQYTEQELYEEMQKILLGKTFYQNELSWHTFIAEDSEGKLAGFIEITIYPELSFCSTKPVGYIEAWFVRDAYRHHGVGKGLVRYVEEWLRENDICELASDAEAWNELSHKAHQGVGFIDAYSDEEGKYYKKNIN